MRTSRCSIRPPARMPRRSPARARATGTFTSCGVLPNGASRHAYTSAITICAVSWRRSIERCVGGGGPPARRAGGGPAGPALEAIMRGDPGASRPRALAGRLLRVLHELELVAIDVQRAAVSLA